MWFSLGIWKSQQEGLLAFSDDAFKYRFWDNEMLTLNVNLAHSDLCDPQQATEHTAYFSAVVRAVFSTQHRK